MEQILILRPHTARKTDCVWGDDGGSSPKKKQNKMLIWRKDFYNRRLQRCFIISSPSGGVFPELLWNCFTSSDERFALSDKCKNNNYRFTGKESEHATMEDGGMRNDVSFLFQLNIKVQVRLVETNEII